MKNIEKYFFEGRERRISITAYRSAYELNNKRVRSRRGRYMKKKRMSTVEPVFGILTQHMGLRKINTIGLNQANKCMHIAAIAYNLKKLLKYSRKKVHIEAALEQIPVFIKTQIYEGIKSVLGNLNFDSKYSFTK